MKASTISFLLLFFLLFAFSNVEASQNKLNIKININKASEEELKSIPGIGEVLAKRIIEYRNKIGGFKSLDELKNVKGIGEKKFEAIKPYITLDNLEERNLLNPPKSSDGKANESRLRIFQYRDERGVIHYTQFPERVPDRYRSTLREVR